jgi:hypothetical protein
MRDSKAIRFSAVLAILGSCAVIYFFRTGGLGPHIEPKLHEIVLIVRDTSSFKNPASDIQLASFRKELAKAHATIGSVHSLQLDPLRPLKVPPGDFFEIIRSCPVESVIVSFMGPPLLEESQRSQLKDLKPSIVAFCSGSLAQTVDFRALFEQGLLRAAVVARRNAPAIATQPGNVHECFDRSFLAITPGNLGALSALSIALP